MLKFTLRALCALFILLLIDIPASVQADIAPPQQPPGSNPEPGSEVTEVRMVAETVVLDVQASTPPNSLGQALVSADFTMRNTGAVAESMAVRFPLGSNSGFGEIREIRNLSIKVNGSSVPTRRVMQADPVWGSEQVPWAEFDVTFPPEQDVNIQVSYLLDGTGEYPFISFHYILHTGAGWKDTIGSADLIVRMPYEASPQNILFDEHTGWSITTAGGALQGQEVRWHFEDLEPDQSHDFAVALVMPSAWQNVLKERAVLESNPNDGEAWGRLGKLYKEMFFFRRGFRQDAGGQELYRMSLEAYEKAVTLLPEDALWHAGFADLLAVYSYYAIQEGQDARSEMLRSMQEIQLAQELSPNDPKVKEIAEKIYFLFPEAIEQLESGYDYLWLTATPQVSTPTFIPSKPASIPTVTASPPATATVVPAEEATPTPAAESAARPLCASALLAPLGMFWLARPKRSLRS